MAERLRCVVERITYQNSENGYAAKKPDIYWNHTGKKGIGSGRK